MQEKQQKKSPAGRPPKFAEDSAPVTVTLPLRTLEALRRVNRDRAKAIVACADVVAGRDGAAPKGVEIVKTFEEFGLILVPDCPSLRKMARLRLVEIAPDRFLLVTVGDYSAQDLELDLLDIMERLAPEDEAERPLLEELRQVLSRHRRRDSIASGQILLIGL